MTLNFIDPPAPSMGRKHKYLTDEVLTQLQAHPGKWALLKARATRSQMAAVTQRARRHPHLEATVRSLGNQTWDVYVRWTGGK